MENSSERIGLALSGGGFRATLFHLGVIRYLFDSGLLHRAHTITSVSGGSILAAHLAVNWDKYNESQEAFNKAARELIDFTRRDIRGRIVRRWLCGTLLVVPRVFNRLTFDTLLKDSYARLYRNATLKDLSGSPTHPQFHILATSLTTGGLCKFTSEGFIHFDWNEQERLVRNSSLPLSIAVAASSAFPPLFPPIPVSRQLLNADSKDFDKTQYLTDGGVFDNLGLHELSRMALKNAIPWQALVASDAGGNFDWAIGKKYDYFISRNVRATDILMDRLSRLVPSTIIGTLPLCHIFIGRELARVEAPEAQPPEVQRTVRNIRTDLDAFSMSEIESLVKQGYEEARYSLRECGLGIQLRGNTLNWDFIASDQGSSSDKIKIKDAKRRRLRLFVITDPATWILCLLVLIWTSPLGVIPVVSYVRAKRATAELEAKTNDFDVLIRQISVIRGFVRDDDGRPVPYASVMVSIGSPHIIVYTDSEGAFKADLQDDISRVASRWMKVEDKNGVVGQNNIFFNPKLHFEWAVTLLVKKEGYIEKTTMVALGAPPVEIVLRK